MLYLWSLHSEPTIHWRKFDAHRNESRNLISWFCTCTHLGCAPQVQYAYLQEIVKPTQWDRDLVLHAICVCSHRRNNRGDRGRLVPQLLGWGTNIVLVPQLLGHSYQKARNFTTSSHQDAGFSIWVCKNLLGVISLDPHSGRGDPLPHLTPSPAFGRVRGAGAPVLGPKPWFPQLFSRGCAPVCSVDWKKNEKWKMVYCYSSSMLDCTWNIKTLKH